MRFGTTVLSVTPIGGDSGGKGGSESREKWQVVVQATDAVATNSASTSVLEFDAVMVASGVCVCVRVMMVVCS